MLLLCAAAAIGAGCSAGFSSSPAALPDARSAGVAAGPSWTSADAKGGSLLYVSDLGTNLVNVYTYPGGTLTGKLSGFGSVAGLCSDKAGDVFVVDEAGPVQMFAHGGTTPLRKLDTAGAPYGCAVDPVSGNLALTNLSSYSNGAINIYAKAKGKPKTYIDKSIDSTYFCGYDGSGNLYIDGWNRYGELVFIELPKRGGGFHVTKMQADANTPGGVQFDGKYVAVGVKGTGLVYGLNGPTGKVAQTITLKSGTDVQQFWIAGASLIGPNEENGGTVGYWHYPAGGSPSKTIGGLTYPFGATVSAAK
ncbi:MAG TPA: hypothetical protein VHS56_12335 [Candidatus Cybelea sp.]|nr:hypothetical protein [Candidatus Cybelea sp.]